MTDPTPVKDIDRFWSKIKKTDSCWIWKGAKDTNGYGSAYFNGKNHRASHVSWILAGNVVTKGNYICHKCDNPPCVNPEHLFSGTPSENMRDCVAKGRVSRMGRAWMKACFKGHPYTKGNFEWMTWPCLERPRRRCKICHRKNRIKLKLAKRILRAKKKAIQKAQELSK